MDEDIKTILKQRKEDFKLRLEILKEKRDFIKSEIDSMQIGIDNCSYLLTFDELNPFDIIPELRGNI